VAQRDVTIGHAFPDPYLQAPPEPCDPNKEMEVFWRMQELYQAALKEGRVAEAEGLSRQLAARRGEIDRRDAEARARYESLDPHFGPKEKCMEQVEEKKLQGQLEAFAKEASGQELARSRGRRGSRPRPSSRRKGTRRRACSRRPTRGGTLAPTQPPSSGRPTPFSCRLRAEPVASR